MPIETAVVPLMLWEVNEEIYRAEGWYPYGYEPLPNSTIVNLKREVSHGPEQRRCRETQR